MADWLLLTCPVEGDGFIPQQSLNWPVPLTGEVSILLEVDPGSQAQAMEFELQTDFSGNFSAFSSNGRFELQFLYTEQLQGRRYLTGAIIRHRPDGEDVHAFTAITEADG